MPEEVEVVRRLTTTKIARAVDAVTALVECQEIVGMTEQTLRRMLALLDELHYEVADDVREGEDRRWNRAVGSR